MRNIFLLSSIILALTLSTACTNQTKKQEPTQTAIVKTDKVEVYYFHNERRCATCQAVEDVVKESLKELYGVKVGFLAYNLETTDGEAKAKELGVSGQTLLIVNGETQINLTNEGFMNARNNAEKLKSIIKEKIDALI